MFDQPMLVISFSKSDVYGFSVYKIVGPAVVRGTGVEITRSSRRDCS
jgi:hypothetical protein